MKTYITYNELKKQLFESNCHGRICFEANIFNTVRDYINSFISKLKNDIENNQVEGDNVQFESSNDGELDITEVKNEMHEAVAQIKTEEDLFEFIKEYDSKIKEFEQSKTFSYKTKRIIRRIWNVILSIGKLLGKGISFTVEHWQLILFLVGVISLCIEFKIGPVEALKMAWQACKQLYHAIKLAINAPNNAMKAVDMVKQEIRRDFEEQVKFREEHPYLSAFKDAFNPVGGMGIPVAY